MYGVCGEIHSVIGTLTLSFLLDGYPFEHTFHVFPNLHEPVILGRDFMTKEGLQLNFHSNTISLSKPNSETININLISQEHSKTDFGKTFNSHVIPPQCEYILPLKTNKFKDGDIVLCEPPQSLVKEELVGGKCLARVADGKVHYHLMNPTSLPIFLKTKTRVSVLTEANKAEITQISDLDNIKFENIENLNSVDASTLTDDDFITIAEDLGVNLNDSDLTNTQKRNLLIFIGKNRQTFAKDFSELGLTNLFSHRIETGNSKPNKKVPYRQNPEMRRETEGQVKEMLENDFITESNSPWNSPVVLVKKKLGEFRFAVDYRELNKVTEPMSFPIPHIADVFDTIADAKAEVFSVLDLKSGFWQVPLNPETAHKAACFTHQSVYTWSRLPFGLMNSPITFQNLMSKVLKNLNWKVALVYIDDILVFSRNFDDHLDHLSQVFSNLRAANLTLQPSKCKSATKEIEYLGHIISKHGIKVNPAKTKAVDEYPQPKTAKQVKSFLGMTPYYRKFIKSYAKIANPLNALLKKDTKFKWIPDCENAFQTLKKALASPPILAFPNFDRPFILATDSSDHSMGYVLSQCDKNGLEHPIAYGGRTLHGHELKWHITDKEGLALVEAVNHFRPYLANNSFTVYTDNVSVKWLKHIKNCQGRLGRWALTLQGYNFEIVHKASSANGNADGLSRRVYPQVDSEHSDLGTNDFVPVCQISDNRSKQLTAVTLIYGHKHDHYPSVVHATSSTETALIQNNEYSNENTDNNNVNTDNHVDDTDNLSIKPNLDLI